MMDNSGKNDNLSPEKEIQYLIKQSIFAQSINFYKMIQRIQTLYLLLTTVLPLLFLKLNLLEFTNAVGEEYYLGFKGLYAPGVDQILSVTKQFWPLFLLMLLIPALALITIFLFRNRKLQMRLSLVIMILSAGLVAMGVFYSISIIKEFHAKLIPGIMMVVPVLVLIFSFLAWRGIKKDENLVRSYDRLR